MMDGERKTHAASILLLAFFCVFLPRLAAGQGASEKPNPIELGVETLRVGRGGTETLFADEARLLPGKTALLKKELTLTPSTARGKGSEKISLRAELRVVSSSPSHLVVKVLSRVSVLATTGGIPIPKSEIRREATASVAVGSSELFEVYASSALETRIALNVRWLPGELEAGEPGIPIPLIARVYEVKGGDSVLMSENQLLAAEGGRATATFTRSVAIPPDKLGGRRVRQDRVEMALSPRYRVGKSLSLSLEASGELITLTEDGNLSHPIAHIGDLLLSSGIPASIELEMTSEDPDREGWDRVRYRLEVLAAF